MDGRKISAQCPHCGGALTPEDLSPLAGLVRDGEFKRDLAAALEAERSAMAAEAARLREQLAEKDGQIAYLRDMRARLSTKMLGESLERHCEDEFNKIRAQAYPRAAFGKDNDASSGSKGDYIFREQAPDGTEIASIMFEMKNEDPGTRTRHRNQDFFKELDKDRREKNCEWAVLVSMLEPDSEFYNAGIADVSWAYPKMLVVRPQCFLAAIGLIRSAGLAVLEARREIAGLRSREAAFELVESRLEEFKAGFRKNQDAGMAKLDGAIEDIGKEIARMEKIRDALESAKRQFGLAARKSEGITARKALKGAQVSDT